MAQPDLPKSLMPSLKDRLLDPDSTGTRDHPGYTMQQILESVREDLEELLNCRRGRHEMEAKFPEVARSMVTYGLPDLTSVDTSTAGAREGLGRIMEMTITLHEPRLRNVRASMVSTRGLGLRGVFHIDAVLHVDPAPPVAFETVLEFSTGHTSIRERTG